MIRDADYRQDSVYTGIVLVGIVREGGFLQPVQDLCPGYCIRINVRWDQGMVRPFSNDLGGADETGAAW
jgi:hypothetical protein